MFVGRDSQGLLVEADKSCMVLLETDTMMLMMQQHLHSIPTQQILCGLTLVRLILV